MLLLAFIAALPITFLTALIVSFATKDQRTRRVARITAITVFCVCLLLAGGCWYAYWKLIGPPPPTIAELQKSFPRQRTDLEQILTMSDEDKGYLRIDPDWLDQQAGPGREAGVFSKDQPQAALPKERWDQYRATYRRNGIRQGIERDSAGDAFILVQSEGFLDAGHTTGYLYCNPQPLTTSRYEPCNSQATSSGHQAEHDNEAYSFQRLDGQWYAYSRGPG